MENSRWNTSMTAVFLHQNLRIFPEPSEFKPDRRLQATSKKPLGRYLVSFIKKTRACLGINLAYAELYLMLAIAFHEFDLELYQTSVD
jgi:cytochrome P450